MIFRFAISILIARYLGPEKQGTINYVAAYTSFFISIVNLGIDGVIIHELVNRKEDGKILGSVIILRLITAVICMFLLVFLLLITDRNRNDILIIGILQSVELPFTALNTIKYWYQKQLLSKKAVLVTTLGYIISSIYKFAIIFTKKDIYWFAFATSLDVMAIGTLYLVSYRINGTEPLSFDRDTAIRILKACLPFALANIMIFVYSKVDTIMIRYILNSMELVGFYSTAVTICGYISFVPTAIIDSARPEIMRAKNKDEHNYYIHFERLILALISIGLAYSIVIVVFGEFIIKILYGDAYLGALGSLKIAVWYTSFSFLGSAKSIWLICENKKKYVYYFAVLGALTNLLLNALMIPALGIEGAAFATLITQASTHIIFPLIFKETRGFVIIVKNSLILKDISIKSIINAIKGKQ